MEHQWREGIVYCFKGIGDAMVRLNVNLGDRGYPIYIAGDFAGLGKTCSDARLRGKILLITDSNVEQYYCADCVSELKMSGAEVLTHVIPAGEQHKTLETVSNIYRKLIEFKADRNTILVALGGGVTGDITGFAAATFMRGVPFIQIPTSLIAQADSSIGGKTGVDFEGSKNMVGAFYQPRFVYININTLKTLPKREMTSGLAEVIKHGLIRDADFFRYIDHNVDKIYCFDENVMAYLTKMNCKIKGDVVEQDERENGLREILNFGHTVGHAVESASGFTLLHGECVAIGIAGAYRIAFKLGMVDEAVVEKVEETLRKIGLPIKAQGMDAKKIFDMMFFDKKVKDGKLNFVLPKGIGDVISCTLDNEPLLMEVLSELVAV